MRRNEEYQIYGKCVSKYKSINSSIKRQVLYLLIPHCEFFQLDNQVNNKLRSSESVKKNIDRIVRKSNRGKKCNCRVGSGFKWITKVTKWAERQVRHLFFILLVILILKEKTANMWQSANNGHKLFPSLMHKPLKHCSVQQNMESI